MAKIIDEREAYENLANAIIQSAAEDYKSALLLLKKNPDSRAAQEDVKRLERFFYSEWYEVLTNLDPGYLIRKMKEMVDNLSQEKQIQGSNT
jgi:hypothetical protein